MINEQEGESGVTGGLSSNLVGGAESLAQRSQSEIGDRAGVGNVNHI